MCHILRCNEQLKLCSVGGTWIKYEYGAMVEWHWRRKTQQVPHELSWNSKPYLRRLNARAVSLLTSTKTQMCTNMRALPAAVHGDQEINSKSQNYRCQIEKRAISFFRRGVDEVFAFLGHYVVYVGSCLLTLRCSLSVLSLRGKQNVGRNYHAA